LEVDLEVALRDQVGGIMQDVLHSDRFAEEEADLTTMDEPNELSVQHTHDGVTHFCALSSAGIVNCRQCLADTLDSVPSEVEVATRNLYELLAQAGPTGYSKSSLLVSCTPLRRHNSELH
jgi:hypothetical protein